MTLQPRLLADFAAAPTARERAATRAHWRASSPSLFDLEHTDATPCAVCSSLEHDSDHCPHGTALTLELDDAEHQDDQLEEARRHAGPDAAAWRIAEQLERPDSHAVDQWGRCGGTGKPPASLTEPHGWRGICPVCRRDVPVRTDHNTGAHRNHNNI